MPAIPIPGQQPYSPYTSGTAKTGSSNGYPPHECTWWADERYHQLTGYYVPWAADAHGWLQGAQQNGWEWSAIPPDVPCIIVLQPGVQLADVHYGHVGVVEKVNADGSVTTSDLNWGPDAASRAQVSSVVFKTGPGVDFVWVGGANQVTNSKPILGGNTFSSVATAVGSKLNPNADVAQTLIALDTALLFTNPFDLSAHGETLDTFGAGPIQFPDPFTWAGYVAANFIQDGVALIVRSLFIFAGAAILLKVSSAFIDYEGLYETTKSGVSSLAGLAALA